jgi:MFS transporter, DHA1 family, tetracycline resistance protein
MRIIFLIVLLDLFGLSVIIPLLPFYAVTYQSSPWQVGLIFAIYSICQLIASPILGIISDRVGRRPVLIFSQLGSVAGYLLLTLATFLATTRHAPPPLIGLLMIYASRVIDGISGGNISTAQAYIGDLVGSRNRSAAMGKIGAAFGIGFTIGPGIGGLLGKINIALPALFAALLSAAAAAGTYWRLPESLPPAARRKHRESTDSPLLHPSHFAPVLADAPLRSLMLISFISMFAFVMMESTFAIFVRDRLLLGIGTVGLFMGGAGVVICVMQGLLVGRLTNRFGEAALAITGPALVVVAMVGYVGVGATATRYLPALIAALCVAGLFNAAGRSLQTPTLSALVSHRAAALSERHDGSFQGKAFGLFHMLGSLARALGPLLAVAVYWPIRTWPPFALGGVLMAIAAVWTAMLLKRYREQLVPGAAAG